MRVELPGQFHSSKFSSSFRLSRTCPNCTNCVVAVPGQYTDSRLLPCRSYIGSYTVSMIPMCSPEGNFDPFDFISYFCAIPNMT